MVTQVPLHHVVVRAAPAAIFSELDSCEGQAVVGQLQASWPQGDFTESLLSRSYFPFVSQPSYLGQVTFYRTPPSVTGAEVALDS